ncbi:hypothetical protein J1N35_024729 [Gossypium stocksii]|uniref:Uncharacterized protein n=1 Tax=Gossypium stocksii TaxID=47602 RepID=A0A9D3V5A3_9ROSI|nr:hypothetical protein J1N35_024729 [Gossypium stocksii]
MRLLRMEVWGYSIWVTRTRCYGLRIMSKEFAHCRSRGAFVLLYGGAPLEDCTLVRHLVTCAGQWSWETLEQVLTHHIAARIVGVFLPSYSASKDRLMWRWSSDPLLQLLNRLQCINVLMVVRIGPWSGKMMRHISPCSSSLNRLHFKGLIPSAKDFAMSDFNSSRESLMSPSQVGTSLNYGLNIDYSGLHDRHRVL